MPLTLLHRHPPQWNTPRPEWKARRVVSTWTCLVGHGHGSSGTCSPSTFGTALTARVRCAGSRSPDRRHVPCLGGARKNEL